MARQPTLSRLWNRLLAVFRLRRAQLDRWLSARFGAPRPPDMTSGSPVPEPLEEAAVLFEESVDRASRRVRVWERVMAGRHRHRLKRLAKGLDATLDSFEVFVAKLRKRWGQIHDEIEERRAMRIYRARQRRDRHRT